MLMSDPIIQLRSDRALVTFVNLTNLEFEPGDKECLRCFVLIDVHFLTVRGDRINHVSFIGASVSYGSIYSPVATYSRNSA